MPSAARKVRPARKERRGRKVPLVRPARRERRGQKVLLVRKGYKVWKAHKGRLVCRTAPQVRGELGLTSNGSVKICRPPIVEVMMVKMRPPPPN